MTTPTTPPRPIITEAMKLAAAEQIIAKLDVVEFSAEDLADTYRHPMDGFDICMALSRDRIEMSRDDMEILDEMQDLVGDALKNAEYQWQQEHNIQPTLQPGTRVICRQGFGQSGKGTITGVYQYLAARYEVKEDGDPDSTRRLIVKFEDAQELDDAIEN
jgi:hypothetical protein